MNQKPIEMPMFEISAVTNSGEVRLSMTDGRKWAAQLLADDEPVVLLARAQLESLGLDVDSRQWPTRLVVAAHIPERDRQIHVINRLRDAVATLLGEAGDGQRAAVAGFVAATADEYPDVYRAADAAVAGGSR